MGDDAFGLVEWYPKVKKEKDDDDSAPKKRSRPRKVDPKEETKRVVKPKKETKSESPESPATEPKPEKQ